MKIAHILIAASLCLFSPSLVLAQAASEPAQAGPDEVAGVVSDEAGKPIEGATVDAWSWYTGNETKTDKSGHFSLKKLRDNRAIELKISKTGYSPWYNVAQPIGVNDCNVTLNAKTYFDGRVLAPDGKPVPNALIRANCGPKKNPGVTITTVWLETRSDKEGHYRLYCWGDTYELQVRVPKTGVLRTMDNVVGDGESKALDIQLEPPITLKMLTTDVQTGQPVAGVQISGYRNTGGSGTSDAAGNVEVPDLLPGKLEINFKAKGYSRWWVHDQRKEEKIYYTNFLTNVGQIELDVSREMQPVQVDLEKGVTISGVVQDPEGNPVASACVAPVTTGSFDTITSDTHYNTVTKKDGTFATTLPASYDLHYVLVAHDAPNTKPARKWANGSSDELQTSPGQEIKDVVIKLTKGGVVKGKVTKKSGEPAANEQVRALPTSGNDTRYWCPQARTDKEGNFTLKNVPPGDQQIQVQPFWMEYKVFQPAQNVGVTVEAEGTTEGVELQTRE